MRTNMVAKSLILIEPTNFMVNPETNNDNEYMLAINNLKNEEISQKVISEHKNYQNALKENSVDFKVYKQVHEKAYDSIFACDWFGSIKNEDFPEGILFVFPVRWPSRRLEKNYQLIEDLKKDNKIFEDLSFYEEKNLSLESFGTMSIDFHNRVVYLNLSERCHLEPAEYFVSLLNKHTAKGTYKLRIIESADPQTGSPCFHTGLYLAFNNDTVFLCKDFVKDKKDAEKLIEEFTTQEFKYDLYLLTYDETLKMCANVYEVNLKKGTKNGLVMSKVSYESYTEDNRNKLKEKFEFIIVDVDTINLCAGGSLRCMANMIF